MEQSVRTCLLTLRLGEAIGLEGPDLADAYYLALLRYSGCTVTSSRQAALLGDELAAGEWFALVDPADAADGMRALLGNVGRGEAMLPRLGRLARPLVSARTAFSEIQRTHCDAAVLIASELGLSGQVLLGLAQIFERWDGKSLTGRAGGEAIALPMRLVHLAQVIEPFHRLLGLAAAMDAVRRRSGRALDPTLCTVFLADADEIVRPLEVLGSAWEAVLDLEPVPQRWLVSQAQTERALRTVGAFSDMKSRYAIGHAGAVAALARQAFGQDLQAAALIHDVGRVAVSTGIWERPGPLTLDSPMR